MIRKLILSAVIATGAITGMTLTPSAASAAPPIAYARDGIRHGVRFEVLVRHRGHWDTYATYRDRDDARRAAWMLERQGYDARIEVERGR
jgi:hypothetical protein